MLTDIPNAKQYIFMPVADPALSIPVGDTRICGEKGSTLTYSQLLMDEIAKVMTDDDIVGTTGVITEKCLMIVKFDRKHAYDLIAGGTIAVNALFEEYPHLAPKGGFSLRDWDTIPDSEKAGNPANKK